jgi:hypothetical protein
MSSRRLDNALEAIRRGAADFLPRGVAIAGPNNIQAKLVQSIVVAANELDLKRDRRILVHGRGLKRAYEHDRAFLKHVPQSDALAGKIIPIQVGFLDKEDFVLVPAGNFHTIMVGTWKIFGDQHVHLRKKQSRFQANEALGSGY